MTQESDRVTPNDLAHLIRGELADEFRALIEMRTAALDQGRHQDAISATEAMARLKALSIDMAIRNTLAVLSRGADGAPTDPLVPTEG